MTNEKNEGRVLLPSMTIPNRYDIQIIPNFELFTFTGKTTIRVETFDCGEDCKEIKMHAKELCFASSSFRIAESTENFEAIEIRVNLQETTVTFIFSKSIPSNSLLDVEISFNGFLNNQMAGFYRSSYTNVNGEKKIMASTQFEALDARRAFPCWDEPARKAVFSLSLIVPCHLVAFSNMPEMYIKSLEGGKLKEIQFLDSPKMSTYLLAYVVGEFDFVQKMTEHGVMVRVYTPPGKSSSGNFALDCAAKCLDLYDDFFGIPYPLPKLDMVAIPEFAAGAMENWGCVTYREVDVLINENSSSSQKQRVCVVVNHELAHQWFGNLVTMNWWDDLWLNEGFASWTETFATDKLFPEWKMWDQFTTDHLTSALRLDALRSSHPIQVPIKHAEEVEQVFDSISYSKGSTVIRMIRAVLGAKSFQSGLKAYMKKHQYGNTETIHLWQEFEDASGLPVKELMSSWTEQMGFPLLKVSSETWTDEQVTLELEQSWFLSDGSKLSEEEHKKIWCIPILTCTAEGTQQDMTLMREKTASISITLPSSQSWLKLNAGQEVPMRVCPSECMLQRLLPAIKEKTLSPSDRAGILNDVYAIVKSGQMTPVSLLQLLSSYINEDDSIVWHSLVDALEGLNNVLTEDHIVQNLFKDFVSTLIMNLAKLITWVPSDAKSDDHLTSLLRGIMMRLISIFCYNDDGVRKEAESRFNKFIADPSNHSCLPSDIRSSVFKIILKNGGQKEYDNLKAYFNKATDNAEKKIVLVSIGAIKDEKLKYELMEWCCSGAIKLQDFFYVMSSVSKSSSVGRDIAWRYFQENFDKIYSMVGIGLSHIMDSVIVICCGSYCSFDKATEIEAFFEKHPCPKNSRIITQTLENMRANASFFEKLRSSEELSDENFWETL